MELAQSGASTASDDPTSSQYVFTQIERIIKAMQHPETGIPVRSQKIFLTNVPCAFTGYDLVEWMMNRLKIVDSVEALHLANLLSHYGYFFPVDNKVLQIKDDNSLYRFQTPYFWVSQNTSPDDTDYAVYLVKSAQKARNNKKEVGLDENEQDQHQKLRMKLIHKWDFVTVQAEEQVKLAKDRKKVDKVILDSQEKAFWRVHRPPPGEPNCMERGVPRNCRSSFHAKRRTKEELKKDIEFLKTMVARTRLKTSQAAEGLLQRCDNYCEHDAIVAGALPSNPWVTDDTTLWFIEAPL